VLKGYLLCEGYSGYDAVGQGPGVILLACWAPARRHFIDAIKIQPNGKPGRDDEIVTLIAQRYRVEKEHRTSSAEERNKPRQAISQPILDNTRAWLYRHIPIAVPKSVLGEAMAYMDGCGSRLVRDTGRGDLPIDNNETERAIRPFAIGRRAWLFCDTPAGV
jgi:hypothetical protein